MSTALHPCESCARHVRVTSVACPFCGSALSDAFRATPPRPAPTRRLGRAATFAFGAALATGAAAGCGGSEVAASTTPAPTQPETVTPAPPDTVTAPAYGGPPAPDQETQGPAAAYGGPPQYSPPDGNMQPLYGVPPKD